MTSRVNLNEIENKRFFHRLIEIENRTPRTNVQIHIFIRIAMIINKLFVKRNNCKENCPKVGSFVEILKIFVEIVFAMSITKRYALKEATNCVREETKEN